MDPAPRAERHASQYRFVVVHRTPLQKPAPLRLSLTRSLFFVHPWDAVVWFVANRPATVAAVELYSVLVGGIPSKPEHAIHATDLEALNADEDDLDWQMNIVIAFFDSCVPNQPGCKSSSVFVAIS